MFRKRPALILFGFCFLLALLSGQEKEDQTSLSDSTENPEEVESSDTTVLELERGEPQEEPLSLFERTMGKDIETAGYYELVAWVRSLGLSDQGSSDSLREDLYDYYDLSPTEKHARGGAVITVKSAKDTDYFTIEEPDHQMIRLKGDVLVEMEEEDSDRRHIIRADELIFNQTENTITATGNLDYRMVSGDYEDVFYGDSLTFSLSSWNGVIFKGSSLRTEEIDGESKTFYFNGNCIRKSGSGGIFILEEGDVQTQNVDNPDFHLRAQRLWLMGPREWGIEHGILYMGHIPVLYIPFYYKPGNEMIFNPVIGTKLRVGNFIQTTTYLIGRKDPSDNLSFFKLGDTDEGNYKLVREGLYLMKVSEQPEDETDDTLKVMADWYSRLGGFSGISGEFTDLGKIDSLELFSGIGVSRTISDSYEIYFEEEDGVFRSDWNSMTWGDREIPFRWAQSLDFDTDHFSGTFQFYSDPYFDRDYMDREESFDWLNTVLTDKMSDEDEPDLISDMEWNLTYFDSFSPDILSPFVESISMQELRFQLDWNRKSNESEELKYANDPARQFFYPETTDFPYAKFKLSGTPFSYSTLDGWGWSREKEADSEETVDEPLIEPPWSTDQNEEEKEKEEKDEELLEEAGFWNSRFSNYSMELYQVSLDYSLSSMMNVAGETGHEDWDTPEDMDFSMDETLFLTNNSFSTNLDNQLLDNMLGVVNSNTFSYNYRTHMDALGAKTDDLEYSDLVSDYKYHSVNWDNDLDMYYYPLKSFDLLSQSKISYTLDNMLYEKAYESYEKGGEPVYTEEWAEWDEEKIDSHNAKMVFYFNPDVFYFTSSASYNLPPLDRLDTYTNTTGFEFGGFETSISHSFTYAEEDDELEWESNPLTIDVEFTPFDNISLEYNVEYDFEEDTFTSIRYYIYLWGLYAEYEKEYTTPYKWDSDELGWVSQDENLVPSTFSTGLDWDFDKNPFWKNRITWDTDLSLDYTVNLQQFTSNTLTFIWYYHLYIFQFMDLDFSMKTVNSNMYLYFPEYREQLGINEEYSIIDDLYKSFNLFDEEGRYDSFFNLKSIGLDLVHHLREWDLTFSYAGWPELEDKQYEWKSEFSIFLKWNPIPQIQADIQYTDEEWLVDTEED